MSLTLYRLVPQEQALKEAEDNPVVDVTDIHPGEPTGDNVLYELHPVSMLVQPTDDDHVFQVRWADVLEWPYQQTAPS